MLSIIIIIIRRFKMVEADDMRRASKTLILCSKCVN